MKTINFLQTTEHSYYMHPWSIKIIIYKIKLFILIKSNLIKLNEIYLNAL